MGYRPDKRIVIVGQGYVGLPLALAFAQKGFDVTGFDISPSRISDLQKGVDHTGEADAAALLQSGVKFTSDPACLGNAHYIIVTVPTPTDKNNRPDFSPLKKASQTIGQHLMPGRDAIIIFESTVYPTTTERFCGPLIEDAGGLKAGVDFKLAYSPERINPGDKQRPLTKIVKIVSGQDEATLNEVAALYETIIEAGIYRAPSIAVAEAAKVIENTQRDLNIALMNELALICDRLDISTNEVIEAAGTKWNFLKFSPGLVGGHCIGVDPYYLTAKAEELGYHPEVILSGRRINDYMPEFVGQKIIKLLAGANQPVAGARIGILGLSFKEDVPDYRNSKVFNIIAELNAYHLVPMVHDPFATPAVKQMGGKFDLLELSDLENLHALVICVPHSEYKEMSHDALTDKLVKGGVLVDVKSMMDKTGLRDDLTVWCL